ncbi:MAG: transcription termination factor Rho, partial [Acidimicrobiales bacterium]
YVAVKMARTLALRKGDFVTGRSRPAQRNEKNPALQQVDTVGSLSVEAARERPDFDELTPVHPTENLIMQREGAAGATGRILDLVTPLAKGQRSLVVAPPRSGKTATLTEIAQSIEANHADVSLFIVQLDERPEEVTKMRRAVPGAEIVASAFGRSADEHIAAVELTLERAKRLAELGNDVVVLLDGLTRLVRAYSLLSQGGGRVSASSVDAAALFAAKRCFGTACKLEEGGSITIVASIADASEGTVDGLILDEFKDAANATIVLDAGLAARGVFPSIDVSASSTRDEHLLMDERSLELVHKARRSVIEPVSDDTGAPLVRLLAALAKTPSTEDFLNEFA